MQLQQRGLLSVDDPIRHYIPDYPNGEKITLHHLLPHTSGIAKVSSISEHWQNLMLPATIEEVVLRVNNPALTYGA